jgi:hypothetical protein
VSVVKEGSQTMDCWKKDDLYWREGKRSRKGKEWTTQTREGELLEKGRRGEEGGSIGIWRGVSRGVEDSRRLPTLLAIPCWSYKSTTFRSIQQSSL